MSLFDLHGKVAVITGSSKGIGKAIAQRLVEHGAKVVISSRKADACEAAAADIRAAGGQAHVIPAHIGKKEDLQALIDGAVAQYGRLDVLVCNAAVNPYWGPSAQIPDEAYDRIMGANVRSNLWLVNMALPHLKRAAAETGDASVILISSIGGLRGSSTLGVYGISKAADMQMARMLATEHGAARVRANCIAPGLIKTDMARALWEDETLLKKRCRGTPLLRIGEPDEIAGAAVFLASKASGFMTGQTMVIDGGVTAGIPEFEGE